MNNNFTNPFNNFQQHVRAFWNYKLIRPWIVLKQDLLTTTLEKFREEIDSQVSKTQDEHKRLLEGRDCYLSLIANSEKSREEVEELFTKGEISKDQFESRNNWIKDDLEGYEKELGLISSQLNVLDLDKTQITANLLREEVMEHNKEMESDIRNVIPYLDTLRKKQDYEDLLFKRTIERMERICVGHDLFTDKGPWTYRMYLKVCRLVVGRLIRRTVKATVNYHLGIEGYFSDPEKFNKFQSIVTKSIKFTTIGILGLSIIGAITVLFFQLPHEFQITEKNLSPIGMNEMNIYDHINRGNTDFIDPTIL